MCRADFPKRSEVIRERMRLLHALRRNRHFPAFEDVVKSVIQNNHGDYLAFSLDDPQKVSYADKCHRWDDKRRRRTSLGRYLKRKFSILADDYEIESFVSSVLKYSKTSDQFKIISGDDIIEAYRKCVGCSSCMTGEGGPVNLYAENKNVRMLIYSSSTITARALLWTCDDGTIVLDRIYPGDTATIEIIHEYAKKQRWVFRTNGGYNYNSFLSDDRHHCVTLKSSTGLWPYMDTFRFADGDEYEAVISDDSSWGHTTLDSTEGNFDSNSVRCYDCGCREYVDNMTYVGDETYCENCLNNSFTWSDIEDSFIENDEIVYLVDTDSCVSSWYADHYCHRCDRCGEYYRDDRNGSVGPDDIWRCDDCHSRLFACCDECDCEVSVNDLKNGVCSECISKQEEVKA